LIFVLIETDVICFYFNQRECEVEIGLRGWKKEAGCRKFLLSTALSKVLIESVVTYH